MMAARKHTDYDHIARTRRLYRIKLRDKAIALRTAVLHLVRDPNTRHELYAQLLLLTDTARFFGLHELSARASIVLDRIKGKHPADISFEVRPLLDMLNRISSAAQADDS